MAKVIRYVVLNKVMQTCVIALALTGILIVSGYFVGIWRPSNPLLSNPFPTLHQQMDIRLNLANLSKLNCTGLPESEIRLHAGNLSKLPNCTGLSKNEIRLDGGNRNHSKSNSSVSQETEIILPPGIVAQQTDLYLRRLWGNPSEDLPWKPKYLVTFTVGVPKKYAIDRAVAKFSGNFTVMLFHYDDRVSEWAEFEWSSRAVHVSAGNQTKWWFAKRFLHPDVVAPYDYIFVWDEDLGLDHFDAEEYVKIVKRHGLQISQPALDPNSSFTWSLTKRRSGVEVHKTEFVEIMAPVFSNKAWNCVWKMIQNDLVHAWGLDFALRRCVRHPANATIGVVDSQWVLHKGIPSLGRTNASAGHFTLGRTNASAGHFTEREAVRLRSQYEWDVFKKRMVGPQAANNSKIVAGSSQAANSSKIVVAASSQAAKSSKIVD